MASAAEAVAGGAVREAAEAIREADALLICTGAGMGVDSGLGTFRGKMAGVWPPLRALCMDFSQMSCPRWFDLDPRLAWAFWHFRHQAYTKGTPHEGYNILAKWGAKMKYGFFSVTSNIDGHWVRTEGVGDERTYECHGSVMYMQHVQDSCENLPWPTDHSKIDALEVPEWDLKPGDEVEAELAGEGWKPAVVAEDGSLEHPPAGEGMGSKTGAFLGALSVRRPGGEDLCRVRKDCPLPGDDRGPWRPAVLMFGDGGINTRLIDEQRERFEAWLSTVPEDATLAVVEIGAGTAVYTIRCIAERTATKFTNSSFVRINLEDPSVPSFCGRRQVALGGLGALAALSAIDAELAPSET